MLHFFFKSGLLRKMASWTPPVMLAFTPAFPGPLDRHHAIHCFVHACIQSASNHLIILSHASYRRPGRLLRRWPLHRLFPARWTTIKQCTISCTRACRVLQSFFNSGLVRKITSWTPLVTLAFTQGLPGPLGPPLSDTVFCACVLAECFK